MTEPPPVQRNPTEPAVVTPQLLVMPPNQAIPSMVWPGPEGQPAWAIPVQIPAGTRGYALFVPMVAVEQAVGAVPAASPEATAEPKPVAPKAVAPDAVGSETVGSETEALETAESGQEAPEADAPESDAPAAEAPEATATDAAAATPAVDRPAPPAEEAAAVTPTPSPAAAYAGSLWEDRRNPGGRPVPHPGAYGAYGPYRPQPTPFQKFRDKHWRGPKEAKGRTVPAAVLAGALGLAVFLPLSRVGIGWFLGWLVLAAGIVVAVRRTVDLPRSEKLMRIGWGVSALALMLVPAFRNAWWLVTFSVLGALGCTALAIVGGNGIRSILFSLFGTPYAAFRGLPWVRKHLRVSRNPGMFRRIGFSIGVTVVVLLVFGALLSSADVAFSVLLDRAVPDLNVGSIFVWIFLAVVGALIAVAGTYTLSAPPTTSGLDTEGRRRFGPVEWAPASLALVGLFVGFVVVQFAVLFGGRRHVLQTSGLSYAEYARSGFWQLVAVTLLTLGVLGAVARWARRDTPAERLLLRIVLGLLCALSVIIVASALSRMWTYQKVYSFTGERIFVMSFELLLGAVFVMIAIAGIRWKGKWIPRGTIGLTVLLLLTLAVLDPEAYAASRNIVRYEQTGKIDAWYLRALSADATPALTDLPDPVRRCTLSWIADDLKQDDPWYGWNLGRAQARKALKELGPDAIGNHKDCRAADQFDLPKTR